MAGRPEVTASQKLQAAQLRRDERTEEIVLLLAWLARQDGLDAHLAPARNVSATSAYHHVLCLHHGDQCLSWRVSDLEVLVYFKRLKVHDCGGYMTRSEKLATLADIATM